MFIERIDFSSAKLLALPCSLQILSNILSSYTWQGNRIIQRWWKKLLQVSDILRLITLAPIRCNWTEPHCIASYKHCLNHQLAAAPKCLAFLFVVPGKRTDVAKENFNSSNLSGVLSFLIPIYSPSTPALWTHKVCSLRCRGSTLCQKASLCHNVCSMYHSRLPRMHRSHWQRILISSSFDALAVPCLLTVTPVWYSSEGVYIPVHQVQCGKVTCSCRLEFCKGWGCRVNPWLFKLCVRSLSL